MTQHNLFAALRAAFPTQLDATAIETDDGQYYTWRDLDRGTAMIANLLASLDLPEGARVAVQTEKSVEALMLYLATLRAGYVYLPLNTAYQQSELDYFIGNAEPSDLSRKGLKQSLGLMVNYRAATGARVEGREVGVGVVSGTGGCSGVCGRSKNSHSASISARAAAQAQAGQALEGGGRQMGESGRPLIRDGDLRKLQPNDSDGIGK